MDGGVEDLKSVESRDRVQRSLVLARRYLRYKQRFDGEFPIYVARDPEMASPGTLDHNYFGTAIIVDALSADPTAEARAMRNKAARFLASGYEEPGYWRFWPKITGKTIDPDLDVTAVVAAALRGVGSGFPQPSVELFLRYRDDQGRFLTWVRDGVRNDVDSVVNANVLWYLGDVAGTEGASAWVCQVVREGTETGSYGYYENNVQLYHAIGRAVRGGTRSLAELGPVIEGRLLAQQQGDGSWGTALTTALALHALKDLGCVREGSETERARRKGVGWLLEQQTAEGCWARGAAWNGPEVPEARSLWWGGETLVGAFSILTVSGALDAE